MPELPEVEVLARHLAPLLKDRVIHGVEVRRSKVIAPATASTFSRRLRNARFTSCARRGKYLLFEMQAATASRPFLLVGHLGMTGRMYLLPPTEPLPRHCSVALDLGSATFVFEDTRYFGRLTLETEALNQLGPEPLGPEFTAEGFAQALRRYTQSIKVKLLDQSLVAGIGNIYASEALFRAGISPRKSARRVRGEAAERLWRSIREVLSEAIACGSTVPLNFSGTGEGDGLFYFGRAPGAADYYTERLRVYDRAGHPCEVCGAAIKRLVQAARSTYYCPHCQH